MELFKLVGSIAVDNANANKSIDETTKKTSNLGSKLGSGIKTAAKWGAKIATVGVAAGTAAAGGIAKLASNSASAADRIDKMSQKIGISRKSYQELDFVCSQSGASVDSLKMGIKTLTSVMDTTAAGTSKSKTALEQLGVAATDSSGKLRGQEEVMWECFSKLQGMSNQTEKARLATELFGKSGSELMPMLNGASGSIEEMQKKANELGLVMSDKAVDAGVKFTDTMDQLKRTAQAAANKIGAELLPSMNDIGQGFIGLITGEKDATDKISKGFSDLVGSIKKALPSIVQTISLLVQTVAKELPSILTTVLPVLIQCVIDIIDGIIQALPAILTALMDALPVFINGLVQLMNGIIQALPQLVQILCQALPSVIPSLVNGLVLMLVTLMGALPQIIQPIIDNLPTIIMSIVTALMDNLPALITGCVNLIVALVEQMPQIIEVLIDYMPQIISECAKGLIAALPILLAGVGKIVVSLFNYIKKLFKIGINGIKTVFSKVGSFFSDVWNKIKKPFVNVGSFFKVTFQLGNKKIKDSFASIGTFFSNVWNKIKKPFANVGSFFKETFEGAVKKIKEVFNGVLNIVKKPVNAMIGLLNGFIKGLNKIKIPSWVPKVGGKGINIPEIPELAEGGVLERGQVGLLEGNGAEAVVPLEKNTEWIDRVASRFNASASNEETNAKLDAIISLIQEIVGTDRIEEIQKAIAGTGISWNKREIGRVVKSLA